jgi:hypothetical protein
MHYRPRCQGRQLCAGDQLSCRVAECRGDLGEVACHGGGLDVGEVLGGASRSGQIRVCCGTSLLYSLPRSAAARRPDATRLRCQGSSVRPMVGTELNPGLPQQRTR